jgi:hypothetical protein
MIEKFLMYLGSIKIELRTDAPYVGKELVYRKKEHIQPWDGNAGIEGPRSQAKSPSAEVFPGMIEISSPR